MYGTQSRILFGCLLPPTCTANSAAERIRWRVRCELLRAGTRLYMSTKTCIPPSGRGQDTLYTCVDWYRTKEVKEVGGCVGVGNVGDM